MDAMRFTERGILDQGADGAAGYFRQAALDLFGFRPQLAIADNIKGASIAIALRAPGGTGGGVRSTVPA